MTVQKLNLQVDQGTDFEQTIIAKTSTGSIIDLTGYTVAGQIRKTYDSGTATAFTAGFGVRANGEVTIALARSVTSSLEAGRYVYDVEITSDSDKRSRLAQGQVTVTQEVTRSGPIDYIDEVSITNPVDGSYLIYDGTSANKWIDDATIKRVNTDNIRITANVEANGFSGTGSVTITDFIDDDTLSTATSTNVPTAESVKAYVDSTSAAKDTIAEMNDTNIASPSAGQFLIYDGTDTWDNKTITGDVTFSGVGVASITSGSIVNADIKSDAAISVSKTALTAGTGLSLDTDTLSLSSGAALTNLGGDTTDTGSTFLRKDGTFASTPDNNTEYTAGTGLSINGFAFSLSSGAALTNLGGDGTDYSSLTNNIPLFNTFLRKDGQFVSVKQYSGGSGITVIPSSNVVLNDTIQLSSGAALENLSGGGVNDDDSTVLARDGTWVVPPDTNTEYTGGTGISVDSAAKTISIASGAALTNLGGGAGDADGQEFLNEAGEFIRPHTYVLANTGLTFVANTTAATTDFASFKVNSSLTHLTNVGSSNNDTHYEGQTLIIDGTITGNGAVDFNSTLNVDGSSTLNALTATTFTANGAVDLNSTLNVDGSSTLNALTVTTLTANGDVTVKGGLTVEGTTTTIDSTTLTVDDKNIELGSVTTPTDTTADGGGITLKGATDKTLNWIDSTDSWTSSENFELASGKAFRVNANEVLSQTTLGSTVLASSLTSVGTLTGLTTGATTVNGALTVNDNSVEVVSADPGAAVNPTISLYRNSASPVATDDLGAIQFYGNDDGGNKTLYAQIHGYIEDETDASNHEDGQIHFSVAGGGSLEDPTMSLKRDALKLRSGNDLVLESTCNIRFEGDTNDTSRTTLYCIDPTADRTVNLPDADGTVITTGNLAGIIASGALNSGSITSGFGSIDNGASSITTTGAITGGTGTFDTIEGNVKTLVLTGTQTLSKANHSGRKLVFADSSVSTITIPDTAAGTADVGVAYTIINAGTAALTINRETNGALSKLVLGDPPSSETTLTLSQGAVAEFVCTAENVYSCFGSGIT